MVEILLTPEALLSSPASSEVIAALKFVGLLSVSKEVP